MFYFKPVYSHVDVVEIILKLVIIIYDALQITRCAQRYTSIIYRYY